MEEVHGADYRLFELVEQAHLPDLESISGPVRLPRLRRLFETLYDGVHPLRIALDKFQSLDTVRSIDGKTGRSGMTRNVARCAAADCGATFSFSDSLIRTH